jgi:hypothetical protein
MFRHRSRSIPWLLLATLVGVLGGTFAILSLTGCGAGTQLTDMWRDPAYDAPPMQDVLVLSMRRNPAMRRAWEDGFVAELGDHRIKATPSYRLFPDQLPDTAQVMASVRDQGFDGVLINYPAGRDVERRYVPGYMTTQPVTYRSPWSGYYSTRWRSVYEPGYVTDDQLVYNEVQLWDLRSDDDNLVWAGTTETVNPTSSRDVNHEIGEVIVPELVKQGILGR